MKLMNFKHLFFWANLTLCIFAIIATPDSVIAKEKKSTETTECVLKKITTLPEQELVVERGKSVNVTVKVRCKGDIPAVGFTVKAVALKGKKAIELSPASAVTDEYGKAVFTVTGNKKTEEDLAELKFTTGELATKLAVKVRRTECKPGIIKTEPEKELVLEQGMSSQVSVKVKCENGSPATDAKVDALVQVGSGKIDISPSAELTDANGIAIFTVTGVKETQKEPATIRFMTGPLKTVLNVKVNPVGGGIVTTECIPKKITTIPEQELVVERGKSVNATVKVKCKDNTPAVGFTVEAVTLKGKKAIELAPASAVTDEEGKAVFTVTGNRKTEEDIAEIKFTLGELATRLAVKVRRTECKPGKIKLEPEQKLVLEQGKSSQVTVKVICENGSPAVDAKVDALVQAGSGKIDLSSSAELTDASGKAIFTVTGIKETKKEPATIRFMTGDLKAYLNVKVKPITGVTTPKEEATPKEETTPETKVTPQEEATPKEESTPKEEVTPIEVATPEAKITPQEETAPK